MSACVHRLHVRPLINLNTAMTLDIKAFSRPFSSSILASFPGSLHGSLGMRLQTFITFSKAKHAGSVLGLGLKMNHRRLVPND